MNIKYYTIIGIILVFLTLSCVSADGNFTELQDNLNSGNDTLELEKDYSYYAYRKDPDVIHIENKTVNGNNHMITGYGCSINVSGDVRLNDIVFTAGNLPIVGECNSLLISNCTFMDNQKNLFINVTANNVVINNSRFIPNNIFTNNDFCKITSKSASIINSSFVHVEDALSRAVDLTCDEFTIINSTFANFRSDFGSAVYTKKGRGSIINSRFINNTAYWGGAIYSNSQLEVMNCEFNNNSNRYDNYDLASKTCGGAIYLNANGNVIADSRFINNAGFYSASAVFVKGDNTLISNSYFNINSDSMDGVICWKGNSGTIKDSIFVENNGFTINWMGNDGKIINSSFTDSSDYIGNSIIEWKGTGGLISQSKFLNSNIVSVSWQAVNGQIDNCEFVKNKRCSILWNAKDGRLSNSMFSECSDTVGWYGANGVVDNCRFEKNAIKVVQWDGVNGKIMNSKFNGNNVFYDVLEVNGKNCLVDRCEFISNNGKQYGAIRWNVNNGKIQNSIFRYNTANWGDGAIAIGSSYKNIIKNNVYLKNTPIEFAVSISIPNNIYYGSGQAITFKFIEKSSLKPMKNIKVSVGLFDGSTWTKYYDLKTDSKGVAKIKDISKLKRFLDISLTYEFKISSCFWEYDVDTDLSNYKYLTKAYKEADSGFKMKLGRCIIKAPKLTAKIHKSKYFKISVKNKFTNKVLKNFKLKVKVFTGKKFKTYILKTNKKGVAKFNTKNLSKGNHKVVINSKNPYYYINKKSTIKIK